LPRPQNVPSCFTMSAAWWKDPDSPLIFSSLNVDMTNALAWINTLRERTGEAITVTHLCAKVLGMVLRKYPQVNAKIEGNRIMRRKTADVVLMVSLDSGEDISAIKVGDVDQKNLLEISREIREGAIAVRENRGPHFQASKDLMKYCSVSVAKVIVKIASFFVNRLGIDFTRLGFPDDPFGSAVISSVNMHGIESAYGPLIPVGRCGFLLVLPEIMDKPWVEDGKLVVRPVLKLCMTFDHRIFHGYYVSLVENEIRRLLQNPEEVLEGKRLSQERGKLCVLGKSHEFPRRGQGEEEAEGLLAGYGA
jgi:pyruvate/2-oxoglutarate dehydrogenase complex dihydrolipoamide acyltransferase (E2) component